MIRGVKNTNIYINCDRSGIFPNAALPVAVMILDSEKLYGIRCEIVHCPDYLLKAYFVSPLEANEECVCTLKNPLNTIFRYSNIDGQISSIMQAYVDYLSKHVQCESGVLDSLIWCINEVLDNVQVHSQDKFGYVMAQYHKKKKRLNFCVFDSGIGILESLNKSPVFSPESDLEAIELALKEGVGEGNGQGNGLFGLYRIVSENSGRLTIRSGNAAITVKNGVKTAYTDDNFVLPGGHKGTTVDFQLDLSQSINLQEAMGRIPFDGFDIRVDDMWLDENTLLYDINEHSKDTGTRASGKEIRLDILNILNRREAHIVLDFSSVEYASSSFLDESIAILFSENPYLVECVSLANMNETIEYLFKRSMAIRTKME